MFAFIYLLLVVLCHHHLASGWSFDLMNRREALLGASSFVVGTVTATGSVAHAEALLPIAVIGANGRTGSLCVSGCLDRGIPVRALTRSGTFQGDDDSSNRNNLLTVTACDVRDPTALQKGLQACRGVIYAASASKNGGSAKEIDNIGVVSAAEACLQLNIPRYVLISSTAVTRPNSLGYKFTNILGGIMDEKKKGEEAVIQQFQASKGSISSYVIIRPGGLEEPKKNVILGPSALELSQGDALAGIISRADLAEVAVESVLSKQPGLKNAAFELYYTDSAQPCEGRFKALLNNGSVARLHGDSYEELFRGIKPDGEYPVPA